jgi:hypothetical protein
MADFNIPQLYKQVFGISAITFNIPDQSAVLGNSQNTKASYTGIELIKNNQTPVANYQNLDILGNDNKKLVNSTLGTPIYEQITLTIPAVQSTGGQVTSPQYTYVFPDWPLFDISPSWTIKKENILGGNGTVKEYIQQDDFQIKIRGFLINYSSQDYPEQLVKDFWKVINCQKSIGITSMVFNILNIRNIIVTGVQLPSLEGFMNIQPFEIDCISDEAIELLIKKA